jgi:hypothetical protein
MSSSLLELCQLEPGKPTGVGEDVDLDDLAARDRKAKHLFNGFISIIAIQVSAIEMDGAVTLVFTTVLDRMTLGTEEDEEQDEPADRGYWLTRASAETLGITEELLKIIQEINPGIGLKYNKQYIGLARTGVAGNYVSFVPRKKPPVLADFKIPRSDETDQRIEAAGIEMVTYRTGTGYTASRSIRKTLTSAATFPRTSPGSPVTPITGRCPLRYRQPAPFGPVLADPEYSTRTLRHYRLLL